MMVAVAAVGEGEAASRVGVEGGRGWQANRIGGNPYLCNKGGARGTVRGRVSLQATTKEGEA